MEVTQRFQLAQDTTFQLLEEIEVQGAELEQVVTTVEKQLEGSGERGISLQIHRVGDLSTITG
jgi:hypothetical protein